MKKLIIPIFITCLVSCKSAKKRISEKETAQKTVIVTETPETTTKSLPKKKKRNVVVVAANNNPEDATTITTSSNNKINNIVNTALSYNGTRYRYGGTDEKGMDCSGLVYTSFINHDILLPRTSNGMSDLGDEVKLKKVEIGDLLFFATGRSSRINHVGLVIAIEEGIVKFIHASTSRGVIISSMTEGYWSSTFKKAKRLEIK